MRRIAALLLAAAPLAAGPPRRPPELRTASGHAMKYWVSLPAGWTKGKAWPVVVVVPDARREFRENLEAFADAGKDSPLIFVAPLVLTCGGPYRGNPPYPYDAAAWKEADAKGDFRFDADGIAAAVADVNRLYGGEEKYFLTGWEAGGHTVWAMLFQHPDALRAAAPVSPNFRGRWIDEKSFSKAPVRDALPVRVLFCDAPEGKEEQQSRQALFAQSKEAMDLAKAHGFANAELRVLPGRKHGPLASDVVVLFSSMLGPSR